MNSKVLIVFLIVTVFTFGMTAAPIVGDSPDGKAQNCGEQYDQCLAQALGNYAESGDSGQLYLEKQACDVDYLLCVV